MKMKRWLLIVVMLILGIGLGGFFAFNYGLNTLKSEIEKALGPNSEVKEIKVGLTGVEITGIKISAVKENQKSSWPLEEELRAARIVVVPDWIDLLSAKINLQSIEIDDAYISVLRDKQGKIRLLPSLLDKKTSKAEKEGESQDIEKQAVPFSISKVILKNGVIDFVDTSLGHRPVKLRMEKIAVQLGKISLPDLKGQTSVDISGMIKGAKRDGSLAIKGNIELATYELGLVSSLKEVDLIPFQPYLLKSADTGIKNGSLSLELNSSVSNNILRAPGTVTLQNLELATKTSSGLVIGISQNLLLDMMKSKTGKITVRFVLEGNINDPKFSLNEDFASKFSLALADTLGVSIEGLAKGVRGAGGGTIKGLGDLVRGLNKRK